MLIWYTFIWRYESCSVKCLFVSPMFVFFALHHACVFPLWMVGVPAGVCVFVYVFVVFVCLCLCLFIIFVCFPLRMVGGSRLVVVFHRLFACNHQRLIAEGKLLANTAGSKQKAPQKRHRYQDTHGIRCRRCFQKHSMINQIYISSPLHRWNWKVVKTFFGEIFVSVISPPGH